MTKGEVHVNTVEAKNRFNELIAKVQRTKQPIIVAKRNEPVAVVISYESYQEKGGKSKKRVEDAFLAELLTFHQSMKKKYPKGTGESAEILREIRLERGHS